MSIEFTSIAAYRKDRFTAAVSSGETVEHDIYSRGSGAPVILIQELPGIGKETLRLADKLVDAGFEVILPHLFGPLEKISFAGNFARVFCMRKELDLFAKNQSSPIVDWLKALCQHVRDTRGVKGVGVIGMCLTGNFAISLIGDDSVLAAVASQPASPLFGSRAALHMAPEEVAAVKTRLQDIGPMLAYRFERDPLVPESKFKCINAAFNGEGRELVKLNTLPGKGHSVLALDFVDEEGHPTHRALEEIIGYFRSRLGRLETTS